jgi:methyl-accepting chemotaxis protein
MGPAIATVAEENVESMLAVEIMLTSLVDTSIDDATRRRTFRDALDAAALNVTEDEEAPLLTAIRADVESALSGNADARRRVIGQLEQLAEVNRAALRRADREARRLADAGAWAAAVLAVVGFVFVLYVASRVDRRFVMPILEISTAIRRVRQGDPFRRCSVESDSPEIQGIADDVNHLLDRPHT